MDWRKAEKNDDNHLKIPERWIHLHYYEALNILFRFENSLRVFVYAILKNELKEKWQEAALSGGGCIRSETKKRITQQKEYGYLGHEVSSSMLFLNSGELIDLIVSDAYWKHFARFFKASKSIVTTKLQEIGTVRNSLAHFRPIKEDDIDLIKQNTKHVMLEIEKFLIQLTSINTIVPTNSEEIWYKNIKPIGSENIVLSIHHSNDEQWIRISISYKIPTLIKSKISEDFYTYKIGNLKTINILRNYPELQKSCIYITEQGIWGTLDHEYGISAKKEVNMVISKKSLAENIQNIKESLKEMTLKIDEETDLLKNDSLAMGSLIEPKPAHALVKSQPNGNRYWSVELGNLNTPVTEVSDVEFWGKRSNFETDFVSATSQYPWMPSSISSTEILF